ncbi:putative ferric-chelate reductase 1 homolog [Centruroides vittatus]|uniref:putative ferric-chelate reductase 1 homolog n=1 Tax=Centruroides vittatus TaxID=120091 RepID=UPI0035102BD7
MIVWRYLLIMCAAFVACRCFDTGAPIKACQDMILNHKAKAQKSKSPYLLTVTPIRNKNSFLVKLNHLNGEEFQGFFLQARLNSNKNQIVSGTFASSGISQTRNCFYKKDNALTHINKDGKTVVTTKWTPPPDFEGEIIFRATVAKNFNVYWTGIESGVIKVTKLTSNLSRAKRQVHSYNECDQRRGCFGLPNDCIKKSDCTMFLSYYSDKNSITFELVGALGTSTGWIAIGLSEDSKMGSDSVTECIYSGQNITIQQSWNVPNPEKSNELLRNPKENIIEESGYYENGVLTCKWKHSFSMRVKDANFDLLNKNYYLLLAKGSLGVNKVKEKHTQHLASINPVNLNTVSIVRGKSSLLVKIHGSFMVATWIGLVSIGILLARYYKQVWEGSTLCKSKIWFATHRAIMLLSVSLVIAAFVVIFKHKEGWSEVPDNPHPILGVVTTGLIIVQMIAGLARPSPNSSQRPVFNWLHWFIGNCTQITAVITIFFAVPLEEANLEDYFYWILIGFIGFHFIFHIIMLFHTCIMDRKDKNEIKMHQLGQNREPEVIRDAPGGGFRRFMLGIYITVTGSVVAALVLIICLN